MSIYLNIGKNLLLFVCVLNGESTKPPTRLKELRKKCRQHWET
jgi:hypothetical protein